LLCFARTTAAIDRLLALGVSIDERDRWGIAPIDALSKLGKVGAPLVRHLARRGVAIDAVAYARLGDRRAVAGAARPEVIHAAIENGRSALLAELLEHGADPNARSRTGATCLHAAAWIGNLEMVELLLARGAEAAALDDEHHNTPAGWAEHAATVTNNPACLAVAERLR
jgi:ankyrin repeat protein